MLAELCRKRESRKLTQAEIVRDLLSRALLPHEPSLREAFRQITQYVSIYMTRIIILNRHQERPV